MQEGHDGATDLRGQLAEAEARAQAAIDEKARVAAELAAATDAASAYEADIASMRALLDDAAQREREAAAHYRALVAEAEPWLLPEDVAGETVAELAASVTAARGMAQRLSERLDARVRALRVPAGAPPRGGPDVSAMTPDEKIKYGLAQRR
jgi:hypothetical protein